MEMGLIKSEKLRDKIRYGTSGDGPSCKTSGSVRTPA